MAFGQGPKRGPETGGRGKWPARKGAAGAGKAVPPPQTVTPKPPQTPQTRTCWAVRKTPPKALRGGGGGGKLIAHVGGVRDQNDKKERKKTTNIDGGGGKSKFNKE